VNQLKLVTTDNMIYQAAVHMGVFLGDATYSERHAKTHLLDA
jgi:hypothetical protein